MIYTIYTNLHKKENNMSVELSGEAAKIWEEIRYVELDLFGLPDQTVEKHCKPAAIASDVLYVTIDVSAAFAALDVALSKNFTIESVSKWYTIARKVK